MTDSKAAFLAVLEAQRADFRRSVPERLAQIESLWRMVLDGDAPAEPLANLERRAHGLAGSGATFGCRALGDAARALELAVHPLVDRATGPTPTERAAVAQALEALRALPAEA